MSGGEDAVEPTPSEEQLTHLASTFPEVQLCGGVYWACSQSEGDAQVWAFDGWDWACCTEPKGSSPNLKVRILRALKRAFAGAYIEVEDGYWMGVVTHLRKLYSPSGEQEQVVAL